MSFLIFTDLDRTLVPNGPEPVSPDAMDLLRRVAERPGVRVVFVTGRSVEMVDEAVERWDLVSPSVLVTDVGTAIHSREGGSWERWASWRDRLAADWGDGARERLRSALADLGELREQEPERQNEYKLSYYAPPRDDLRDLLTGIGFLADRVGVKASLVASCDVIENVGLVDVLPPHAGKLPAIEHVMERERCGPDRTIFAGDSGNDLPVLASRLPAVVVANAAPAVREEAVKLSERNGTTGSLYLARGGLRGMNGNYAAGILEGLVHFHPEAESWLGP